MSTKISGDVTFSNAFVSIAAIVIGVFGFIYFIFGPPSVSDMTWNFGKYKECYVERGEEIIGVHCVSIRHLPSGMIEYRDLHETTWNVPSDDAVIYGVRNRNE